MNWVDLAVLGLVAVSGMVGFLRGLVREVLGVAAWVGAAAAAIASFGTVAPIVRGSIADPTAADAVALGAVFLAVLIVLWFVARAVSGAVQRSAVGGLDRTLGLVFGIGRGAALVVVAYILAGLVLPADQWPAPVLEARTLPTVYHGAAWAAAQLPPAYRPIVTPPPAGRATSAAALLHANPVGRATGPRPPRE